MTTSQFMISDDDTAVDDDISVVSGEPEPAISIFQVAEKSNGFSLCDVNVTSLMRTGISSVVSTKIFPILSALPRSASVFLLLFSFEEGQSLLFSLFDRMVTYKQHTALFIGSLSMKTTFVLKLISVPLYHFTFTFFKAIFPDLTLVTCSAF